MTKEKSIVFRVREEQDKVLRKNVRSQERKGGKLDKNWTGSLKIVARRAQTCSLTTSSYQR